MYILNIAKPEDNSKVLHIVITDKMMKKIAKLLYPDNAAESKGRDMLEVWLENR